jgi:hypothetical protein
VPLPEPAFVAGTVFAAVNAYAPPVIAAAAANATMSRVAVKRLMWCSFVYSVVSITLSVGPASRASASPRVRRR